MLNEIFLQTLSSISSRFTSFLDNNVKSPNEFKVQTAVSSKLGSCKIYDSINSDIIKRKNWHTIGFKKQVGKSDERRKEEGR